MSSSRENSAERCIEWNDADDGHNHNHNNADVTGSGDDSDVAPLSSSVRSTRTSHGAGRTQDAHEGPSATASRDDERRIAYDSHDHTQWHTRPRHGPAAAMAAAAGGAGGDALSTSTTGASTLGVNDGLSGKYVVVRPLTLSDDGTRRLVRLPHPRHGRPAFFVLHTPVVSTNAPRLFEMQAQGPPNDFGQTFVAGEEVLGDERGKGGAHEAEPSPPPLPLALSHSVLSQDLLLITPFNAIFLALHALISHSRSSDGNAGREDWDAWASTAPFVSGHAIITAGAGAAGAAAGRGQGHGAQTDKAAPPVTASPFALCGDPADEDENANEDEDEDDMYAGADAVLRAIQRDRFATRSRTQTNTSTVPPPAPSCSAASSAFTAGPTPGPAAPLQFGWWPGWAAACAECPELTPLLDDVLTTRAVLSPLCELRSVVGGDDKDNTADVFYRFSPAKAAAWVRGRVETVRASRALAAILQIPHGESTSASADAASVVPLDVALAVVCEYVPETFHDYVAKACGLVTTTTTAISASSSSSATSGQIAKRTRAEMEADAAQLLQQQKAAPKSASVRRLEKAGRPANTPTLMSMFAKKAPTDKK